MNATASKQPATHRWRFFRAGGFDQALLTTGADLMALSTLDQKLWVALSCPVEGLEFDRRTLEFVDTDGDGHIRAPEILAALAWSGAVLADADLLARRGDRLPLSALREDTEEGRAVLAGARLILSILGRDGASEIDLDEAGGTARIFSQARFNGDGVVPERAAEDPSLAAVVGEIVACLGGEPDRSGATGVTAELVKRFFAGARALAAWREAGRSPDVLPFGEDTAARHALFRSVRPKVDDYFRRCRLAAYDARAAALLSPSDADYREVSLRDLDGSDEVLSRFPLAVAGPGKPLPLGEGLNPAWADAVRRFVHEILPAGPGIGAAPAGEALTEEAWEAVRALFAPYEAWLSSRPDTPVGGLAEERLRTILAEDGEAALLDLVARDVAVAPAVAAIASVERILRYCRDLHLLVNNFVSFRDFYTRKGKATFQAGTLYLDGRSCDLCVAVKDVDRHAAVASLSQAYLAYCECTRPDGEKMTIAAAFTAGDSDYLMVGRNGVFYDRKGRDWNAAVVRIVENPIGIRQAFWGPYKRVVRMVGEQIQKLAAARSRAAEERAAVSMLAAGTKAAAGKPVSPPAPAPFDVAKFAGIFAAIGLAVGAIGTALASVFTGILRLSWWQIPLALAGILLLVSGPSVIIAWFKLRKRNLGPILDANGWAVNARARINIPFGASLTSAARLPENAERSLADPFAEKKRPWRLYLTLLALGGAVLYLWRHGDLSRWLGR